MNLNYLIKIRSNKMIISNVPWFGVLQGMIGLKLLCITLHLSLQYIAL